MSNQEKAQLLQQVNGARAFISSMPKLFDGLEISVGVIKDITIPTEDRQTQVKMYAPSGTGPYPAVFFLHGGAFCLGDNSIDEPIARQLVRDTNCIVFSVDYGLAPEYPFPSAIDEIYSVIKHVISNADQYCVDPQKISIGGSSSGATLAIDICILSSERKEFFISALTAIYPALDMTIGHKDKLVGKAAGSALAEAMVNLCVIAAYLEGDLSRLKNPLISPAYFENIGAFPPTVLISAEKCPFTPEHDIFFNRLKLAGVEVLHKVYPGVDHGFMDMGGFEDSQRDVRNLICAQLKSIFSR